LEPKAAARAQEKSGEAYSAALTRALSTQVRAAVQPDGTWRRLLSGVGTLAEGDDTAASTKYPFRDRREISAS
jgi:hypothetical protein